MSKSWACNVIESVLRLILFIMMVYDVRINKCNKNMYYIHILPVLKVFMILQNLTAVAGMIYL